MLARLGRRHPGLPARCAHLPDCCAALTDVRLVPRDPFTVLVVGLAEDGGGVMADGDGFVEPAGLVQGGTEILQRRTLAVAAEIRRLPGGQAKTRAADSAVNG
jgi:hypothetical protein